MIVSHIQTLTQLDEVFPYIAGTQVLPQSCLEELNTAHTVYSSGRDRIWFQFRF